MADELNEVEVVEKPVAKSLTLREVILTGLLIASGGYTTWDIATVDNQEQKAITAFVAERAQPLDSVTKKDSTIIAKDGRKIVLPAEDVFNPNIIIDSNHIFKITIVDTVTGKIWHRGIIRATDSTGRLTHFTRIQPCSADILNADTITDIK